MVDPLCPERLAEDAVYLGVLTARGVKPLSRLEYPVAPRVLELLGGMGLIMADVTRIAGEGPGSVAGVPSQVIHLILSRDAGLIDRYGADFDGQPLCGETAAVVRVEARYFGYPACCAEAYIRSPHAENGLAAEDQALLFHRACPGCAATLQMIPLYRAALAEVQRQRHLFLPLEAPAGAPSAARSQHSARSRTRRERRPDGW